MAEIERRYETITLTRRLKMPGIMDTMTEQVPEVLEALAAIERKLDKRMAQMGGDDWRIVSHALAIQNGILIANFIVTRQS